MLRIWNAWQWGTLNIDLTLQVFHEDNANTIATCQVYADPHFISFDGVYYDSHSEGTFIYAISDDGNLEVQPKIDFS